MGLVPSADRASICSVTRIVPSSAAIAEPTRPASMVAANTGPSSRTIEMLITEPRRQSHHRELMIRLYSQNHADKGPRDRHHRDALDADRVKDRDQDRPA